MGCRWGGWGSNPQPADYEKYGPVHPCPPAALMTRDIALTALAVLGLSSEPCHEPFHARSPDGSASVTVRNLGPAAQSWQLSRLPVKAYQGFAESLDVSVRR